MIELQFASFQYQNDIFKDIFIPLLGFFEISYMLILCFIFRSIFLFSSKLDFISLAAAVK